ncbi:B-cell receptor CD22-like [Genypterus blacodes]|uniref:B-cell receptor CD22-like n=1 Tax=Genypterus blacodes TaxID=154954 RepID=UPI003F760872
MWGHERSNIYRGPFVFDSKFSETPSKFQYVGDKHQNCSLKIHRVDHNDKGRYTFRFILHAKRNKFTGTGGSTLHVTDLHISVSKPVGKGQIKEGESVSLTCINSCDGGSSAISWFKDRVHMKEGRVLHLDNLSTRSSGSYTCSLNNEPGTLSSPVHVSVGYCPKDTSVSVRPSTEVDISSNITLTCSSDANPPVENYTWFALRGSEKEAVGYEAKLLVVATSVPADGGEYLCSVTNKHGCQNSSPVRLNRKGQ